MGTRINQGQGDATEFKQRGLGAAFAVNLQVFKARFGDSRRATYMHFDLNCGTGHNAEANCIGSPLAFVRAADDVGVKRFFAGFCDIEGASVSKLLSRKEMQRSECAGFHGDNESLVHAIPEIVRAMGERPEWVVGTVLSDPNGAAVPLDALAELSRACPRLDIIVNWNSTIFKRVRKSSIHDSEITLRDALGKIGKAHWLIREPMSAHQWTLLIGRNAKLGDHKALGFYHLDSDKGRDIFERCNYTGAELREIWQARQGGLF